MTKGKGWFNESHPHSLAARGIKVRKFQRPRSIILNSYKGAKYPDAEVNVLKSGKYVRKAVNLNPSRKEDAKISNGFYDPETDTIYIKDQPSANKDLRLLLHELLHDAGGVEGSEAFNEGLTDYFARDLMVRKYGIDKSKATSVLDYTKYVKRLDQIAKKIGEAPLKQAYFYNHSIEPIVKAVTEKDEKVPSVQKEIHQVIKAYEKHPNKTTPELQKIRFDILAEVSSSMFSGAENLDDFSLTQELKKRIIKKIKDSKAEFKALGPKEFYKKYPAMTGGMGFGRLGQLLVANPAIATELGILFGVFGTGFVGGELIGESFKHYKEKKAKGQTLFSDPALYKIVVTKNIAPYQNGRVHKTVTQTLGGNEDPIVYDKEKAEETAKRLKKNVPGMAKIEVKTI